MLIENKLDRILEMFVKYLASLALSPKSFKNYKSDLNHFLAWAILKIRSYGSYIESLTDATPFLSNRLAHEYKNYMTLNSFPIKTINRRLSTLRHLSRFLLSSQMIDGDFMAQIENVSEAKPKKSKLTPIVKEFQGYLEAEKTSPNTIKNYISDIRQFLTWLETNQPPATNN